LYRIKEEKKAWPRTEVLFWQVSGCEIEKNNKEKKEKEKKRKGYLSRINK